MPKPIVEGGLVKCRVCGREYVLCPDDDYFNATNAEDGTCELCLLHDTPTLVVVNPEQGVKLQKEFEERQKNRGNS